MWNTIPAGSPIRQKTSNGRPTSSTISGQKIPQTGRIELRPGKAPAGRPEGPAGKGKPGPQRSTRQNDLCVLRLIITYCVNFAAQSSACPGSGKAGPRLRIQAPASSDLPPRLFPNENFSYLPLFLFPRQNRPILPSNQFRGRVYLVYSLNNFRDR